MHASFLGSLTNFSPMLTLLPDDLSDAEAAKIFAWTQAPTNMGKELKQK